MQWSNEKGQTATYKILHRKPMTEREESHKNIYYSFNILVVTRFSKSFNVYNPLLLKCWNK